MIPVTSASSAADVCKLPTISIGSIKTQLRKLYGLEGEIKSLNGERDRNFLITTQYQNNSKRFVFKIANQQEDSAILSCQEQVFSRLSCADEIETIEVVRSTAGHTIERIIGDDGVEYLCRLTTFLAGPLLSEINPRSSELLESLGRAVARVDVCLDGFADPALDRPLLWIMQDVEDTLARFKPLLSDPDRIVLIDSYQHMFRRQVLSVKNRLRSGVIHNDANDNNIVVTDNGPWDQQVIGLIDFGDMVHSWLVADLAIACAYAMLGQPRPLDVAASIVKGYQSVMPLRPEEVQAIFSLICMRLSMSVCICAYQKSLEPDNDYLSISERSAWELLEDLRKVPENYAHYVFRDACDMEPAPTNKKVLNWLQSQSHFESLVDVNLQRDPLLVLDTSVSSPYLSAGDDAHDPERMTRNLFRAIEDAGAVAGIGRYDEYRLIYGNEDFADFSGHRRTLHIGLDVFQSVGSRVFAPLSGRVWSSSENTSPLDYGGCLILVHEVADEHGDELVFYSLYGHLDAESFSHLQVGEEVTAGKLLGCMGEIHQNGFWPPHVHFEIILDMLECTDTFFGVGNHAHRNVWISLCPDPNLILKIPDLVLNQPRSDLQREAAPLLKSRQQHLSGSLSLSYRDPIVVARGVGQYLFDANGKRYIDAVNNVPHVGHCHPHVVQAGHLAAGVLNTNTRYLYPGITNYAERLLATFPKPLSVVFLVNSGSEANDLALRLAWCHTKRKDIVVLDHAYHGNLTALIDLSPYKHDGPGGTGNPSWVHKVPMPDGLRGQYRQTDPDYAEKYASLVHKTLSDADKTRGVAAFICESILGCGGQVVLPGGYLNSVYQSVRAQGGVCIADEVQTGFGRVGSCFWAFELQQVVPDIVTLGKPAGNGHPLAAVVTTKEVAQSFVTGMEYFNTFGGNPVSCAIGNAVLDVIEREKLQSHALDTGNYLMNGLGLLKTRFPLIAEVRGEGLFIGVELVSCRETMAPAAQQAAYISERMKQQGILLSTDGPCHNVLKIKPPMVFNRDNADQLVDALISILAEDWAAPGAYGSPRALKLS
jgi:4-aminobutyrate aminotransferase-like enzyme/Ser/Thr protein kinase RdoA (MazF antagonist)